MYQPSHFREDRTDIQHALIRAHPLGLLIHDLTQSQELVRANPWHVEDAPPDFVSAQLKGIIGVEIPIARIEGKWKMSQNRSEPDRVGVIEGFREQGERSAAIGTIVAERSGLK